MDMPKVTVEGKEFPSYVSEEEADAIIDDSGKLWNSLSLAEQRRHILDAVDRFKLWPAAMPEQVTKKDKTNETR